MKTMVLHVGKKKGNVRVVQRWDAKRLHSKKLNRFAALRAARERERRKAFKATVLRVGTRAAKWIFNKTTMATKNPIPWRLT